MKMIALAGIVAAAGLGRTVIPSRQPDAKPQPEAKNTTVLAGKVVDEHGQPIPGVKLQVYGGLATRFPGPVVVTDEHGEYRFDPLETGAMTLDDDGGLVSYYTGVRAEHDTYCSTDGKDWWDLTIPRNQTVRHDLTMIRGGNIAARFTHQDGAWGVGELDVRILNAQEPLLTTTYATTDHKGRFETVALAPGEYVIQWNWPAVNYAELARVRVESGVVTEVEVDLSITATSTVTRTDRGEAK